MNGNEFSPDGLLWALTHRKESLSWGQYKRLRSGLALAMNCGLDTKPWEVRMEARLLDALGHVLLVAESASEWTVKVEPTVLAALPVLGERGMRRAVLCGGRTPATWAALEDAAQRIGQGTTVERTRQVGQDDKLAFVPDRILVKSPAVENLQMLADSLEIKFLATPPAWHWLAEAPTLPLHQDLDDLAAWPPARDATAGWIVDQFTRHPQRWKRRRFDPNLLNFVACRDEELDSPEEGPALYEYVRTRPNGTEQRCTYLWDDNDRDQMRATDVDRDWGRYELLRRLAAEDHRQDSDSNHDNVIRWCREGMLLLIPANMPVPQVLARTAAMCFGLAPVSVKFHGKEYLAYRDIPKELALLVAARLGQELTHANRENVKETKPIQEENHAG